MDRQHGADVWKRVEVKARFDEGSRSSLLPERVRRSKLQSSPDTRPEGTWTILREGRRYKRPHRGVGRGQNGDKPARGVLIVEQDLRVQAAAARVQRVTPAQVDRLR